MLVLLDKLGYGIVALATKVKPVVRILLIRKVISPNAQVKSLIHQLGAF